MIKPIPFNTEMVRAILEGRKTVTRRIMKPQPCGRPYPMPPVSSWPHYFGQTESDAVFRPPYRAGDILWVRETWCMWYLPHHKWLYCYKTTDPNGNKVPTGQESDEEWIVRPWRPSIHMPKEATRLFLQVTGVRVERLQDMTEEDAFAEGYEDKVWCEHPVYENYPNSPIPCYAAENPGCPPGHPCNHSIPELFGTEIWDSTIKPADRPLYGWEANPWVWVIQFERCEKPEGF